MATPKRTSAYPREFLSYFETAYKSGLRLLCSDKASAQYLRLRLYGLREAMRAENHPQTWFADQLTLTIQSLADGTAALFIKRIDFSAPPVTAQPLGLEVPSPEASAAHLEAELAQLQLPSSGDSSTIPHQPSEPVDPVESALKKLGFFSQADKPKKPSGGDSQ